MSELIGFTYKRDVGMHKLRDRLTTVFVSLTSRDSDTVTPFLVAATHKCHLSVLEAANFVDECRQKRQRR